MDINLGSFDLTNKQFEQSNSLKNGVIKGFSYRSQDNSVIVVSERTLTNQEIADLKTSISNLPDEDTQEMKDTIAQKELDAVIEAKKTELAVAALKIDGVLNNSGIMVNKVIQ